MVHFISRYHFKTWTISLVLVIMLTFASAIGAIDLAKVMECMGNMEKVDSFDRLDWFLMISSASLKNGYLNLDEASQCLGLKSLDDQDDSVAANELSKLIERFHSLLELVDMGEICQPEASKKLLEFKQRISNVSPVPVIGARLTGLGSLWDRFIRQVIVSCKRSLLAKMKLIEEEMPVIGAELKDITNFAQNLNLYKFGAENDELITRGADFKMLNMAYRNFDEVAQLVRTTGELKKIIKMVDEPLPSGINPTSLDVELSHGEHRRMLKFFGACDFIRHYESNFIDPLMDLIGLDYHDRWTDSEIGSYAHIHVWVASIETCHILEHVYVLEMWNDHPNYKLRFKVGNSHNQQPQDMAESAANLVKLTDENGQSQSFARLDRLISGKLDRFSRFDKDLMATDRWLSKPTDASNEGHPRVIGDSALNESFLALLVNYIKATNLIQDNDII